MKKWNQFEAAKWFYEQNRDAILKAPRNEWGIAPYSWEGFIHMTPIEEWLWGDIREANAVFYPQYPVGRFFVDFANPVVQVALECDGAAYHQDKAKDAARDEELANLGWSVYRITGSQCRSEFSEETGREGYGRQFVEIISDYYGLKRNRPARGVSGDELVIPVLEHILAANDIKEAA